MTEDRQRVLEAFRQREEDLIAFVQDLARQQYDNHYSEERCPHLNGEPLHDVRFYGPSLEQAQVNLVQAFMWLRRAVEDRDD